MQRLTAALSNQFHQLLVIQGMNHGSLAAANRGVAEYELSE